MNTLINADMNEFWNGDGGHKWLRFQDRIAASFMHFGQVAMNVAGLVHSERVLDVGCGCGDTSFEIANRVGPEGIVQGIDISELILARANGWSAREYNVEFVCADAQSFPFESKGFDVAFSRFGVMFFDDPVSAFSNIRRALIPGGRMTFICWQPVIDNQWVNLPLEVAANHAAIPSPADPEEPGAFSFGDTNRIVRVLKGAGFSDTSIKQFDTTFNVGTSLNEAVTFLANMGSASAVINDPDLDQETRTRIINELYDALMPYMTAQGVGLNAATWIVTTYNPINEKVL